MNKMFKINGNPEQYEDLDVFHKLAQQFLPYAQQSLGFDKPVGVNLLSDPENLKDPLGKTAYYDLNKMEITLFVDKRHVKDILRSMAHELVHHTQNCRGEFDGGVKTEPGYAQDDEHMRKMEAEAYLKGSGFLLRDWEDSLKENITMSKQENILAEDAASLLRTAAEEGASEEELEALRAKAGVPEPDPSQTPNLLDPDDGARRSSKETQATHDEIVREINLKWITRLRDAGFTDKEIAELEGGEEIFDADVHPRFDYATGEDIETMFEGTDEVIDEAHDCGMHEGSTHKEWLAEQELAQKPMPKPGTLQEESWLKGNKDQLLFERLVDKWIK